MSKNQQINYTTKPIKLPLSTEKEYVLVDVEGYLNSHRLNVDVMKQVDLTKPFRLDRVSGGSGYVNDVNDFNKVSAVSCYYDEYKFFHEVIRQPQPNEFNTDSIAVTEQEEEEFNAMANSLEIPNSSEWKNGDACSYYYWEGKEWRDGVYVIQDNGFHVIRDIEDDGYAGVTKKHLRKPETQEQREERERLEAAYDLYTHVQSVRGQISCILDWFSNSEMEETRLRFLAIVDKTGYRPTK